MHVQCASCDACVYVCCACVYVHVYVFVYVCMCMCNYRPYLGLVRISNRK